MERPGFEKRLNYADKTRKSQFFRKTYDGTFTNLQGDEIFRSPSYFFRSFLLIFRSFLNPVDYTGSLKEEIKKAWITNELGFLIGAGFVVNLLQNMYTYRRNQLLITKKRFLFQQHKQRKFLEDSLRLRSRKDIVNEKVKER